MPMEFTPATVGNIDDLMAGRPVERAREAPVRAAVFGRVDFFANVDGPWPSRVRDEFAVQLDRLGERLVVLLAAGKDRPAADYSCAEQYVIGVRDAAAWTLGVSAKAPFQPGVTVVSDAAVGDRVRDAELMIRMDTQVRCYAEGVKCWMLWLAGDIAEVPYYSMA